MFFFCIKYNFHYFPIGNWKRKSVSCHGILLGTMPINVLNFILVVNSFKFQYDIAAFINVPILL